MTPTYTESQHYENLAFHYANAAILLKCDASVHVEAVDDAVFWEKTFTHFLPYKKFIFIWASNTPSGNETTGFAQCLKYKNYLSKHFFICIDSDYRYLLQEAGISPANFVFQTYTYSIENHLCYAAKLNTIAEQCTGVADAIFDFEAFLLAYSHAVYEAFIWHLYFLKLGDVDTFSKDEFNRILSLNGMPGFSIINNGEVIINELTTRCNTKVAELKATYPLVNLATEQAHFTALGLTRENTYLYVRGHNLYGMIVKLGKEVNDTLLAQQRQSLGITGEAIAQLYAKSIKFEDKLKEEIVFEGYEEIERVGREITQIAKIF